MELTQGHTASKWQSWGSDPNLSGPKLGIASELLEHLLGGGSLELFTCYLSWCLYICFIWPLRCQDLETKSFMSLYTSGS